MAPGWIRLNLGHPTRELDAEISNLKSQISDFGYEITELKAKIEALTSKNESAQ